MLKCKNISIVYVAFLTVMLVFSIMSNIYFYHKNNYLKEQIKDIQSTCRLYEEEIIKLYNKNTIG